MKEEPIFNEEDSNLVVPDKELDENLSSEIIKQKAEEEEVRQINEEKSPTTVIPVIEDENLKISVEVNNEKPKEKANKNSLAITAIITGFVLFLFFPFVRNYYYGIKYINYVEPTSKEEEVEPVISEVPLESVILNETYNKFKVNVCSNTENVVNSLYTGNMVSLDSLTINEIGVLTISSLDASVCGEAFNIDRAALSNKMFELFGNDDYLNEFSNVNLIGSYNVSYDATTNMYTFTNSVCNYCEEGMAYTINSISRATTDGDNLYIYEKFGLMKPSEVEGNYNVFGNTLDTNLLLETQDVGSVDSNLLPTYKWTLKKEANDVYSFVSIEVSNE